MKITEHFSFDEFIVSKDRPDLLVYNLDPVDKVKLWYMCSMILEPVRLKFALPIRILSGKRSPELNEAIGGSPNSDHLYNTVCCAVDFGIPGADITRVFNWMHEALKAVVGQVIVYPDRNFIHASLPTPKHHREFLVKYTNTGYQHA